MKKILISIMFIFSFLQANVAYEGIRTYTQPDGTTFQGKIKGLAEVHWIETTTGDIVQYNFDKKAYYEIDFDENGNIIYTKEYNVNKPLQSSSIVDTNKTSLTTKEKKEKLIKLLQKKNAETHNNKNILKEHKILKKPIF